MMRPRRVSACALISYGSSLLLLTVVLLGLFAPGCREQSSAPVDRNRAPQTVLVGVPGDSTTTFYQVHLYWNGTDEDGEVVGYEWAITDSLPEGEEIAYAYTTQTDSVFIFTVEDNREILGHRFYVRAVDNEGKRDPTPAFTFFSVRNNCIPTAWYTRAQAVGPGGETREITSTDPRIPTDTIPAGWSVSFAWDGADCDVALLPDGTIDTVGAVAGFTYHLAPLELSYIGGNLSDSTAFYEASRLQSSMYTMYIRARDNAGLSGLDPTIRTFVWNMDPVTRFSRDIPEGMTDSVGVFYADLGDGTLRAFADEDTLPLTEAGARIEAFVRAEDPDDPFVVAAYQARLILDSGFWRDLGPDRKFVDGANRYTGTYRLMARSLDGRGRWDGTPDTLLFDINYPVRFMPEWTVIYTGGFELPMTQRPAEGAQYRVTGDTLRARLAVHDPDYIPGVMRGATFSYRFSRYPLPGGVSGTESFYRENWIGAPPERDFEYTTEPPVSFLEFPQPLRLPDSRPFLPGEYELVIRARESYSNEQTGARLGTRDVERTVRFRVVE